MKTKYAILIAVCSALIGIGLYMLISGDMQGHQCIVAVQNYNAQLQKQQATQQSTTSVPVTTQK